MHDVIETQGRVRKQSPDASSLSLSQELYTLRTQIEAETEKWTVSSVDESEQRTQRDESGEGSDGRLRRGVMFWSVFTVLGRKMQECHLAAIGGTTAKAYAWKRFRYQVVSAAREHHTKAPRDKNKRKKTFKPRREEETQWRTGNCVQFRGLKYSTLQASIWCSWFQSSRFV